jgi:hypothetical membrane protein
MKTNWPLSSVAGLAASVVYLIFTLIAFLFYPGQYSPQMNWLSDLGNPQANPSGAIFYNTGCIATSLLLAVFYIGLRRWNTGEKRMKILLTVAIAAGLLSSVFLILSAVFPLGPHTSLHSFWSKMVSVFLGFFLTFSATALMKNGSFTKWIAYYAFLAAAVNFVYGVFLHYVFAAEWVSIGMFIVYAILLSYNSRARAKELSPA